MAVDESGQTGNARDGLLRGPGLGSGIVAQVAQSDDDVSLSRSCFQQKQLNKVTEEQFTILKEDMASSSAIQAKLSTAVNEVQMWHRARFDDELMYNTRCLFEGDIVRYTNAPSIAVESEKQHHAAYSKFYYIPDGSPISDEKLEQIRKDYSLGTKLYAVVGNKAAKVVIPRDVHPSLAAGREKRIVI